MKAIDCPGKRRWHKSASTWSKVRFKRARVPMNRTRLKIGIQHRSLKLANDPMGEWVRSVHSGEQYSATSLLLKNVVHL